MSSADWIKLMIAAARLPLRSEPTKNQFLRPNAHGRIWSSDQLLSMEHRHIIERARQRCQAFEAVIQSFTDSRAIVHQMLARHFLAQHGMRYCKPNLRFGPDVQALLLSYSWPGNVHELRNMLEQTEMIGAHQLTLCFTLNDESGIAHFVNEHRAEDEAPVDASDSMTLSV